MKAKTNFGITAIFIFIIVIALIFLTISFAYSEVPNEWKVRYEVPTDSLWSVASEGDTLYVQWDQPSETDIDRYIFYATIVDTTLDSISWVGNYSEIISSWETSDSTWGSVLTISLPIGFYMAQLVAVDKSDNSSFPSNPAWLMMKKKIIDYTPKRFRIIVRARQKK